MAEISAKAPAMKQGLAILGSSAIANTPLGVLGPTVLAAVAGVINTDIEVMVILLASPTMTAQGKLSAVTGPIAVDVSINCTTVFISYQCTVQLAFKSTYLAISSTILYLSIFHFLE